MFLNLGQVCKNFAGYLLIVLVLEQIHRQTVDCSHLCGHSLGKVDAELHRSKRHSSAPLDRRRNGRRPGSELSNARGFRGSISDGRPDEHGQDESKPWTRSQRLDNQVAPSADCDKPADSIEASPKNRVDGSTLGAEVDCLESSRNGKTIETAVFIDQALDNKFNGLSNGLVELNKDSERQGHGSPNAAKGDIDMYLSNFCNWQQTRLESDRRLWWDHAILLSGLDLYKETPGRNHSGVLGLAWVGGMCKGNYSCTINEASNFESAFVIAHELGHSLGIMHDGQRNRCDPNGFIMSERTGAGKVHWSRCSNGYLNDSIRNGQLRCLEAEQSGQVDSLFDLDKLRTPGQVYTINEQCKMAFGSNHSSIVTQQQPFNAVCRELWCAAGTWARAAHPALEGSSCGNQNRVCREGKCLVK